MQVISGNLLDIESGVIVHQVNCQDHIGAGVAGQLIERYPIVEQRYHEFCRCNPPRKRFGICLPVRVSPQLVVVNSFSQFGYGNSAKTGKVYTDTDKLVQALVRVCERYPDQPIYVPDHIGCGLAGGDWNEICERIKDLPITVVRLPR